MRTRYFQNIQSGHSNALKRVTKTGAIEHVKRISSEWASSAYTMEHLNDSTQFKQISRDEARKLHPEMFRSTKKSVSKSPPPGLALSNTYRKALEGMDIKHSQKIAGIKAVRCINDFGLAESLTIVENFDKFLAFVEEHNELPVVGSRFDSHPFTKKA